TTRLSVARMSDSSVRAELEDELAGEIGERVAELVLEARLELEALIGGALEHLDEEARQRLRRRIRRQDGEAGGAVGRVRGLHDRLLADIQLDGVGRDDGDLRLDVDGGGIEHVGNRVADATAVLRLREGLIEIDDGARREQPVPLAAVELR